MKRSQLSVLTLSFLWLNCGASWGAVEVCQNDPERFLLEHTKIENIYVCESDSGDQLCTEPQGSHCKEIQPSDSLQSLNSVSHLFGPPNLVSRFAGSRSIKKRVLATYLAAMKFERRITMQPTLEIQTGKYSAVGASLEALNSRCMATIVQAAYKLHNKFPNYTFVIDSHIQNCNNLRDGVKRLIANQDRVERNLARIMNPLNSIFLTHETKVVRSELGKMGLHINVDVDGEIERRLIAWEVSSVKVVAPLLNLRRVSAQRAKSLQVSL